MGALRIGLDTYQLITSQNRGIGNYALNLYTTLFAMYPNIEFVMLDWGSRELGLDISYNNVSLYSNPINNGFLNEKVLEQSIKLFLSENSIEMFFTPNALDITFPAYKKVWFGNVKLTGTVHDIIPWILQKKYLPGNKLLIYKAYCDNLSEYDWLFSNSECTKKDILQNFSAPDIYNIYLGPNVVPIAEGCMHESMWDELKKRKRISNQYLIFVAGIGINKNISKVVRVYKKIIDLNIKKDIPQLVIVCRLTDTIKRDVYFYFGDSIYRNYIRFTDFVTDDELKLLYDHASWLVFPTLYEGFGMPVIEGWMHGLPVMTSDNSSLGEISKGCAIQVNPFSEDSILEGFQRIINMDEKSKKQFVEKGRKRLEKFSWKKTCRLFMEIVFERIKSYDKQNSFRSL